MSAWEFSVSCLTFSGFLLLSPWHPSIPYINGISYAKLTCMALSCNRTLLVISARSGLNQVFPLTSGRQFFSSTPNRMAPNFACYQGTWRVTYPSLVADIFRSWKKRIQKSNRHRTFPSIAGSHHPHACTTKEFLSGFLACLQSYS